MDHPLAAFRKLTEDEACDSRIINRHEKADNDGNDQVKEGARNRSRERGNNAERPHGKVGNKASEGADHILGYILQESNSRRIQGGKCQFQFLKHFSQGRKEHGLI